MIVPEALVRDEAPLHGPDELAAGADTGTEAAGSGAGTEGTEGTEGSTAGPAPPNEFVAYVATKPLPSTELSAENSTYMLPPVDVTEAGMLPPLNDPSKLPLLLEPS